VKVLIEVNSVNFTAFILSIEYDKSIQLPSEVGNLPTPGIGTFAPKGGKVPYDSYNGIGRSSTLQRPQIVREVRKVSDTKVLNES
jgi:hypothetical protein